jgi:hypothetical protein
LKRWNSARTVTNDDAANAPFDRVGRMHFCGDNHFQERLRIAGHLYQILLDLLRDGAGDEEGHDPFIATLT